MMGLSKLTQKFSSLAAYAQWAGKLWHPLQKTAYFIVTPTYDNIGDIAIALGVEHFLYQCGYEKVVDIATAEYWKYRKCIIRLLPHDARIFLIGGGNMGDVYKLEEENRRTVLGDFPKHRVVIFPQTIYYKDAQAREASIPHYNRENITITAREQTSYEMMKALYPRANIILAPDVVLSMDDSQSQTHRNGIVLCFRGDSEQYLPDHERDKIRSALLRRGIDVTLTDMMHGVSIPREERKQVVAAKKDVFARAELVITDRLHAMILCAVSGTPCLVFGNNHHKIRGVYEWVKHLDYISFVGSADEALERVDAFLAKGPGCYIPRSEDFQALADAVRPR